jgi:hypothetical protein
MKFFCSSCGQKLELPDDFWKDSVFCASCGVKTKLPEKNYTKELAKVPAVAELDPSKLEIPEDENSPNVTAALELHAEKVESLAAGVSPIVEPGLGDLLAAAAKNGLLWGYAEGINLEKQSTPNLLKEPKVIFWYKIWNAIGVLSLPFLFLVPSTAQEIEIMTIIIAIMFPIWFLHLFAVFLTSRSWHWGYGLFVIIIEVLNCYSWPITVPLICVWCSQNTRNWFKSLK